MVTPTYISRTPSIDLDNKSSDAARVDASQPLIPLLHCCAQPRVNKRAERGIAQLVTQLKDLDDWRRFLQLATSHRILPLVSSNLRAFADEQIPTDLRESLRSQSQASKLRAMGLMADLITVLEDLEMRGVQVIPFKGLILGVEAYGSATLRQFDDIDLWVTQEDFFRPRSILSERGYVHRRALALSDETEDNYCWDMGEYSLHHDDGVALDIHYRLVAGDCSMMVDCSRFWSHLEQTQLMGRSVATLKREDLLIYLCINGMKDGWSYLRSVCDVAALITHEVALDWEIILRESHSLGVVRMVRLGVLLSHQLLDTPLPKEFESLRSDSLVGDLSRRICERLSSPVSPEADQQRAFEKLLLRFWAIEGFQARWVYCVNVFKRLRKVTTHVTLKDQQFIALPHAFRFMYYAVRPIRILSEHQFGLFKVSSYRMFR